MDEAGNLLPGMNVDGVITLEEANDVLTIPVDALMRGNQVYIKDDSVKEQNGPVPAGFKAVEVETGLTNDSYVEIKSGLSEGDTVYVAKIQYWILAASLWAVRGMGGPGGGNGRPAKVEAMAVETVEVMAAVVQDRVIHKRAGQCENAAIVKGVLCSVYVKVSR